MHAHFACSLIEHCWRVSSGLGVNIITPHKHTLINRVFYRTCLHTNSICLFCWYQHVSLLYCLWYQHCMTSTSHSCLLHSLYPADVVGHLFKVFRSVSLGFTRYITIAMVHLKLVNLSVEKQVMLSVTLPDIESDILCCKNILFAKIT